MDCSLGLSPYHSMKNYHSLALVACLLDSVTSLEDEWSSVVLGFLQSTSKIESAAPRFFSEQEPKKIFSLPKAEISVFAEALA